MSNLKPLSRLFPTGVNTGDDFNYAAQLSTFLKEHQAAQSSIIKKKSFLENPINEIERRNQFFQGESAFEFKNKTPLNTMNKRTMKQVSKEGGLFKPVTLIKHVTFQAPTEV